MKLKVHQCISLFRALTALDGAPRVVDIDGRRRVVEEPFELSPKVRWNSVINRNKLRSIVESHEDFVRSKQKSIRAFKAQQVPSDNPKENAQKLQEFVDSTNEEIQTVEKSEVEVAGLRTLVATGFNLKVSQIPVSVLEELMPLIDGDPDFEGKPEKGE